MEIKKAELKIKDLLELDIIQTPIVNTIRHFCDLNGPYEGDVDIEIAESKMYQKTVYDHHHNSDEECYFYLLFLNDEFIATQSKAGDRSSVIFYYYNDGEEKLSAHVRAHTHSNFTSSSIDSSTDLDNHYLQVLEIDGCLYYVLDSPKWGFGFHKNHNTFIEQNDVMVPVKFVKFETKEESYRDKKQMCKVIVEGKTISISAKEVLVKIGNRKS